MYSLITKWTGLNNKMDNFENWVNEYTEMMYSWAFSKTSHKEVAEDLVQETFLSAFENFERFAGKSSIKTWLFSILSNKINDYYRSTSSLSFAQAHDFSDQDAFELTDSFFDENGNWLVPPKDFHDNERLNILDDPNFVKIFDLCLEDLPENWLTAVRGKYLFDRKAEEICQELNIKTTNYWQMLHRAKLLLRKCIESKWV